MTYIKFTGREVRAAEIVNIDTDQQGELYLDLAIGGDPFVVVSDQWIRDNKPAVGGFLVRSTNNKIELDGTDVFMTRLAFEDMFTETKITCDPMTMEIATEIAGRVWQDQEMSMRIMHERAAMKIAEIINGVYNDDPSTIDPCLDLVPSENDIRYQARIALFDEVILVCKRSGAFGAMHQIKKIRDEEEQG